MSKHIHGPTSRRKTYGGMRTQFATGGTTNFVDDERQGDEPSRRRESRYWLCL